MKKDVKRAYLIVKTSDGDGVFETDGDTPMDLRGRLGPWTSAYREGIVVAEHTDRVTAWFARRKRGR